MDYGAEARELETELAEKITDMRLYTVKTECEYVKPYQVMVKCNGFRLYMEVDTGAAMSVISESLYKSKLNQAKLQPCDVTLRTYTDQPITLLGKIVVNVQCEKQQLRLPLLVCRGKAPALMGRDWIRVLNLDWSKVNRLVISDPVEQVCAEHRAVFGAELGCAKGVTATLRVSSDAKPKFCKARPVPYALREAVDKKLIDLEQQGVISPVQHSEWAAPLVCIPKKDGSVRICGDYKVTINQWLDVDQYPLPKTQDLFSTLAGGKHFTKLDLTQAYTQLELDEKSKPFLTINTQRGLYKCNRLPYGVASAPAIFQRTMDEVLQGIDGVVCYLDDILITGKDTSAHVANLKCVLQRLEDRGFRLNKEKCAFFQNSVTYLGHVIDAEGVRPIKEKTEAIDKAPVPKNVSELRSFLAMLNYYGKFIPNLASEIKPMTELLHKDKEWNWSKKCQDAFECTKAQLVAAPVLTHYDPKLPLILACDASPYGIGAVISHSFPNGSERPIAYASRTLTKTEVNYSQIEKEALSIIFGVSKFNDYLYGRQFTLLTDHKPLVKILGPKTGVPTLATARLQRWSLILAAYQYTIRYKPSLQHANADALSRLPLQTDDPDAEYSSVFRISFLDQVPISSQEIAAQTKTDTVLQRVKHFILNELRTTRC